ncbi:envelope stress response membrane protein PspB [Shigella flexneri]
MSALFLGDSVNHFVLFVLPIRLWLHYSNRSGCSELSQSEQQRLAQLARSSKTDARTYSGAGIIDAEHPNWRDRDWWQLS